MRISNINLKCLDSKHLETFLAGDAVPFFRGRVRRARPEEVEELERAHNRKHECSEGFAPAVWLD